MSDRWDELENAYPALAARYPGVQPDIAPMGWFERNVLGGKRNVATTDLNGKIRYNKDAAMRSGSNPDQLLAHELEHARQNQQRSLLMNVVARLAQGRLPWESRPDEVAAVAAEGRPVRRTSDISLPAERAAMLTLMGKK